MSFLDKIFKKGPKPVIAKSHIQNLDTLMAESRKNQGPGITTDPDVFYVTASVELGNTTTKCILSATNLNNSHSYLLNKTVRMTRDIRKPKKNEEVFGKTVWGIELSKEAVADMVKDTVLTSLKKANLDKDKDLDFVVRSTGVTAGFATAEEAGQLVIALADGCLDAGIPPRKMSPAMSVSQLPDRLQKYSLLENIMFDGAVVSVIPPKGKESVANEMEGELVTAGIKLGAKWTDVDYRNPCVSLDFGSTLAGRIVNNNEPYANTVGNFLGLAGVIADSIAKGSGEIDKNNGAALDLYSDKLLKKGNQKIAKANAEEAHKLIDIRKVPKGVTRFGTVPLDPISAEQAGTTLIGCDVGTNGDKLEDLINLGKKFYDNDGLPTLLATMDHVSAMIVNRLLNVAFEEKIITEGSALGITGRAGITGKKPELILEYVQDKFEDVVFVEDGLALGSAIMARCMNSMGTQKSPIGGNQGERCILGKRMKLQNNKF
ncbi:methanogenesis marker 14 protein [Methanobrevibacter sp. OttesenSCG-928-K11]|nr:methanogenesis marker 14 protein [Methanobrevibacter sp. OttesenSCG-928-K11]MDL2271355.1 methanogenesis marker 14 protein [Methanobrevibacter sp. OttesenSCG-928-I08]